MALAGFSLAGIVPISADWREEIGFTRLQQLAGGELPVAPTQGFSQAEALDGANFEPDTKSPLFAGKTFAHKSGASEVSSHANSVASIFYGNTTSLTAGNIPIDLYNANGWLNTSFLKLGTNSQPARQSRSVENHSWISTSHSDAQATEAGKRLDFAIDRDGYVCAVGANNGNSTTLPRLLCQSYHTISVGLVNGNHSAGFTTLDVAGRIKPDIVAPEGVTSFATPMVASAAGLLFSKLSESPYSLTGPDRPRVVKSLLLATATKDTVASWANTPTRPLDLRYGAGELNIHHAYTTLRAGRASSSNSILCNPQGWSEETVSVNSSKTYHFTVQPGSPSTPFSSALTWHREVSKNAIFNTWTATLADLNLKLHHAADFAVGDLISESASSVDNVELIYQPSLPPGSYALVVENSSDEATAFSLAWHSLPAVVLVATQSTAREMDLQAGEVTVTRTGDTALPLFVPLTFGGDAVPGTHFQPLPASVTIPAGQGSATLQIVPIADLLAQGNRNITVSVAADFSLVSDPTQPAVVTIEDKSFDAWRFANFTSAELEIPAISSETADPDGDALPNLIEYALTLDPGTFSSAPILTGHSGGFLNLTATKNTPPTDLLWSAQVSENLEDWLPAETLANTNTTFEARDPILVEDASPRFIRLKITRITGP